MFQEIYSLETRS